MSKVEMDLPRKLNLTQERNGNRPHRPVVMQRTVTSVDQRAGKRDQQQNTRQKYLIRNIHPVREARPQSENKVSHQRSRSKIKYGWYFIFSFIAIFGASKSGLLDKVAKAVQAANSGNTNPAGEVQKEPTQVQEKKPAAKCIISPSYPSEIQQWKNVIKKYSKINGLNPNLVAAVILQESGGDSNAYSHSGAVGLMQVMPRDGLAASFLCVNGPCFAKRPTIEELFDPEFNVEYGTRMLAGLIAKYEKQGYSGRQAWREALKSYGPGDVKYYYADKVLGIFDSYGGNKVCLKGNSIIIPSVLMNSFSARDELRIFAGISHHQSDFIAHRVTSNYRVEQDRASQFALRMQGRN